MREKFVDGLHISLRKEFPAGMLHNRHHPTFQGPWKILGRQAENDTQEVDIRWHDRDVQDTVGPAIGERGYVPRWNPTPLIALK